MSEQLLLDRVEIERQRMREADLNRFGEIEKAAAVLKTRFDAALEAAVTDGDLEKLKKQLEADVAKTIDHICEHFTNANNAQSASIIGKVETMFNGFQNKMMADQIDQKNEMLTAINERRSRTLWWVLGILGSVIAAVLTTAVVMTLYGRV